MVKRIDEISTKELAALGKAAAREAAADARKAGLPIKGAWRMVAPDKSESICFVTISASGVPVVENAPEGALPADKDGLLPAAARQDPVVQVVAGKRRA
jgi:hypothetical protein